MGEIYEDGGMAPTTKLDMRLLAQGFELPSEVYTLPLAESMAAVERAVSGHILNSAYLRDFLTGLLKGPGTSCPDSPVGELQKYAAVRRSEMDMSDPEVTLNFMETVQIVMFGFWRQAVAETVRQHAFEEVRIRYPFINLGMLAASLTDELWVKWFRDVCLPYQRMDEAAKQAYVKRAETVLAEFDYTVYDYRDGEFLGRRTLMQAYPQTVGMLAATLRSMAARAPDPQNAEHLERLAEAYKCTVIDELEEHWAEVDRAWIRIPGSCPLFLVHGMENGYSHPFGVSPELRIVARATSEADMAMIERFRGFTPIFAGDAGLPPEFVDIARQKLGRMDVGVFVSVTESGENLTFRYTGQVVPNRQAILAEGGKTFIAQQSLGINAEMMRGKVERHCTPETAALILPFIDDQSGFMHTTGHEFGHPVGCTPEVDKALGNAKTLLEEAKASVVGTIVAERLDPTPENRLAIVAALVARLIRFMDRSELDNETFAAYVRENLVMANILFSSEVISMTADGLHVDRQAAEAGDWVHLMRGFTDGLVFPAYMHGDIKLLKDGTKLMCDRSPASDVWDLINWVNRGE